MNLLYGILIGLCTYFIGGVKRSAFENFNVVQFQLYDYDYMMVY